MSPSTHRFMLSRWTALIAVALPLAASCAPANNADDGMAEYDPSAGTDEPIKNATGKATAYPEAALVDLSGGYCSGAVIAPRVVLLWRITHSGRTIGSDTRPIVHPSADRADRASARLPAAR